MGKVSGQRSAPAPAGELQDDEFRRDINSSGKVADPVDTLEATVCEHARKSERHRRDIITLNNLFKQSVVRNSFFLWFIGLINNFHCNLIISASSSLAEGYGLKNLVALVTGANVYFGIFARIANMLIATRISYNVRITTMTLSTLVGILFVSFATPMGHGDNVSAFVVMLVGVTLIGTSSFYGESVMLAFLQRYPASLVGAWSSGTGISGVISSLAFMGLTSTGLTQQQTFLLTIPLCVMYWLCFAVGLVSPHKVLLVTLENGKEEEIVIYCLDDEEDEHIRLLRESALARSGVISVTEEYEIRMIMNIRGLSWRSSPAVRQRRPTFNADRDDDDLYYPFCRLLCGCLSPANRLRRWWRDNGPDLVLMHNAMIWYFFNLAVVYIAEYAALLMAPFSFYCKSRWTDNFWVKNSYVISQFCYQFGVLISRSSLLIVKIPFVGVISIIQIINALCWIIQAKVLYIKSSTESKEVNLSFVLFVWMIFIGLMGGASYVNVFYLVLKRSSQMRNKEEQESVTAYLTSKGCNTAMCVEGVGSENRSNLEQVLVTVEESTVPDVSHQECDDSPAKARSGTEGVTASKSGDTGSFLLQDEDREEIEAIHRKLNDVWAARRELGMNIGAMYAMIGITLGTVVDLIFTNTMLKHSPTC